MSVLIQKSRQQRLKKKLAEKINVSRNTNAHPLHVRRSQHSDVLSFYSCFGVWCVTKASILHHCWSPPGCRCVQQLLASSASALGRPARPRQEPRWKTTPGKRRAVEEHCTGAIRLHEFCLGKSEAVSPPSTTAPPKMLLITLRSHANWSNVSVYDVQGLSPCPSRSFLNDSAWLLHLSVPNSEGEKKNKKILNFTGSFLWDTTLELLAWHP